MKKTVLLAMPTPDPDVVARANALSQMPATTRPQAIATALQSYGDKREREGMEKAAKIYEPRILRLKQALGEAPDPGLAEIAGKPITIMGTPTRQMLDEPKREFDPAIRAANTGGTT